MPSVPQTLEEIWTQMIVDVGGVRPDDLTLKTLMLTFGQAAGTIGPSSYPIPYQDGTGNLLDLGLYPTGTGSVDTLALQSYLTLCKTLGLPAYICCNPNGTTNFAILQNASQGKLSFTATGGSFTISVGGPPPRRSTSRA